MEINQALIDAAVRQATIKAIGDACDIIFREIIKVPEVKREIELVAKRLAPKVLKALQNMGNDEGIQ